MLAVNVNPKFSVNMSGSCLKRFRNNTNFKLKKTSKKI